ncbi:major facilitator superfamily domain-containing protein [Absidia repens]|uniref:Major facilitator superfamily domain-containing protein n=1 Tax=Absidia repens TaxID=90262 RepID=A0A1X2J1N4_9FUNG|nr:major facilitator superfamily domain-containing protein [Absidia repens]
MASDDRYLADIAASSLTVNNEREPLIAKKENTKTKANPWHVIGPLFFVTFGMGALLAPMVQFYTTIFCNRYYETDTGGAMNLFVRLLGGNTDDDGSSPDMKDCSIPEIQTVVSRVQAILLFLEAGSSFLMASYYSSLSDKRGRRLVFRVFSIGGVLTMLCYICVAKVQGLMGVVLIVAAPLVRGLLAGDVIVIAAVQSYISDCTTAEVRTVAYGRMVASVLAGIVFGPTAASMLILKTGTVIYTFYLVMAINICFYAYVTFLMPESLDEQAMATARQSAAQKPRISLWQKMNPLSALSILFKIKPPPHINRHAVPLLAAIQFFLSIVIRPPILLYAMLEFKWTAYEGGLLISVVSLIRFIIIIVLLPRLLRALQQRWKTKHYNNQQQQRQQSCDDGEDETKTHYRILFDTWMIRTGLGVETIGFILAALATTSRGFSLALVLQSVSVLSQPSVRSLYTTLVDPADIGALFGAQAQLEAIATILAMAGLNFIYSMSVEVMPSLSFYICAGLAGLAWLLSFLIHPVEPQNHSFTP